MTTEQNKATVRRFYAAFEANDVAAIKQLLAPNLVAYSYGGGRQDLEAHLRQITAWNAAFSDTHFSIEEQIAEGDMVATRITFRANHSRGAFQGLAPTGRQVEYSAISIERFRDGKIVERRVNADWLTMLQQLGLVPMPQPA
jgi:predicted ester cyclase